MSSLGAVTEFEKNRLILTVKTLEAPDEKALQGKLTVI